MRRRYGWQFYNFEQPVDFLLYVPMGASQLYNHIFGERLTYIKYLNNTQIY